MSEIPPEGGYVQYPRQGSPHAQGPHPNPSIRFETIGEAWRYMQEYLVTWIIASAITLVVIGAAFIAGYVLLFASIFAVGATGDPFIMLFGQFAAGALFSFVLISVIGIATAGLYSMALNQLRGIPPTIGDVFDYRGMFGNVVVLSVLSGIALAIGNFFCTLPMFIIGGLLMFAMPVLLDRGLSPVDSLKFSFETLKPHIWMAALFVFVMYLVNILGMIACCIGMALTMPLYILASCILYRDFCWSPEPPPGEYANDPPQPT